MASNIINLFELSYDDINAMKKKIWLNKLKKPKEIVVADNHMKDLWQQIEKLTEILNQTMSANGKFSNELIVVKNDNTNSENCAIALENWQTK